MSKPAHDLTTDDGRIARIMELKTEGAKACQQVGIAMTRDAIRRGAMGDIVSLTGFMLGVTQAAAMHLAISRCIAAGDPDLMLPAQSETLRAFGEQLISLSADLSLVAAPAGTATTQ